MHAIGNVFDAILPNFGHLDLTPGAVNTDSIALDNYVIVPSRFLRVEMMNLRIALCVVGMGIGLAGCTPKEQTAKTTGRTALKEEVGPKTLPEALVQLTGHAETIGKSFSAGKPDDAHHSLHDVHHVLESIPNLAKDLTDEKKETVKKSVADLLECFDALDLVLHGGSDTPYTEVADRIAAALANIKMATE